MTITYDPKQPSYVDEADVRGELTRVFDLCHDCGRCVDFCTVFPSLFEMIEQRGQGEAGLLTPDEQDRVVDQCFQCKRCSSTCPYTPELHEWQIDVPRLMLRTRAMRHATRQTTFRERVTTNWFARPDVVGRTAMSVAPLANRLLAARPGSLARKAVARLTGVSAQRLLRPYADRRFSSWFAGRDTSLEAERRGSVVVFPTCIVEYHEPRLGKDLVRVYERNGIECTRSGAGCCGAPWLHAGDLKRFTRIARENVGVLAEEVRRGGEIVVPQPTCWHVVKHDYPDHVGGPDAELVARHTFDASEYLMRVHRSGGAGLDTGFGGKVQGIVVHHAACQLGTAENGLPGRDLIELTGAEVVPVDGWWGIDRTWGLRAAHDELSSAAVERLGRRIVAAGGDVVVGECSIANTAIAEETGATPVHPIELIARAYGIPDD